MNLLRLFMTKEMEKDFDFYVKHKTELYFYGMVVIATAWLGILAAGIYMFFAGEALGWLFMLFGVTNFGIIKMYLHVRKDAIEIKELLQLTYNDCR